MANFFYFVSGSVGHKFDDIAAFDSSLEYSAVNNRAAERIVFGVENQSGQRIVGAALGRRYALDDGFENFFDPDAFLGGAFDMREGIKPQFRINFFENPVNVGGWKIYFIDHRNDFQIVLQRQIEIGQRLRLHTLGGINQ